jgi:hypothetical protein
MLWSEHALSTAEWPKFAIGMRPFAQHVSKYWLC